jgi:hypothetical protein
MGVSEDNASRKAFCENVAVSAQNHAQFDCAVIFKRLPITGSRAAG